MKNWQIGIVVVVFFILGFLVSKKASASTGKSGLEGSEDATDFEPGKSYPDAETGGTINCYTKGEGDSIETIFLQNTEPPLPGKLYKETNKYACYKFPKQ